MSQRATILTLTRAVEALSEASSLKGLFHKHQAGAPLPSGQRLQEIVEISRSILFPGFYGKATLHLSTLEYHIGVNVQRLHALLSEQIHAGLCFAGDQDKSQEEQSEERRRAADIATTLYGEIISCYPVIKALTNYRLAHELHLLGVPLIPRMMTELAHSETGIDIHPAATIGHHFTIDHGTGVVIGATCIIGNHVKLYQGVTLGAKSFPLDEHGNPIKGIPRHPILEDHVVVYSNATILGRITIGEGCVVGANIWVTEDMEPNTKKVKKV